VAGSAAEFPESLDRLSDKSTDQVVPVADEGFPAAGYDPAAALASLSSSRWLSGSRKKQRTSHS
jgi:hypothetical protein